MSLPTSQEERPPLLLFLLVAGVLSVLVGLAVGLPDYLPTNDGPEHVFGSHALRHLDDPAFGYGRYLRPGTTFSQMGFDQLFGFLDGLLGWRSGLRVCLVVMTLVWAWGVVALAAAVFQGKRRWLGLMGFAAAIHWQLYMGLFPFYLSSAVGFYLLALFFWRTEWNLTWRLVLSAGLAAQALIHPVPAMCTGVVWLVVTLWRAPGARLRELAYLVALGVPAALVASWSLGSHGGRTLTVILPLADRLTLAVTAFVSGPLWRSLTLPLCALSAAIVAVLGKAWRIDRTSGALLSLGLLFALVATQAPTHLTGWQFFSMRFSPLACMFWLLLLPVERWPSWARRLGWALLVGFAAVSNLWALRYNLQLRQESADILSGLEAPIRRHGPRLPLLIEPRAGEPQDKFSRTIPFATANWNLGSIYAVEQGGVPAWTFAEWEKLDRVLWRWPEQQGLRPPRPERGFEWALSEPNVLSVQGARKAAVARLLSYAPFYEDVIFYGRPEEVDWLRERHFVIDYQRGGLAIARFHACPATVTFSPDSRGHSATVVLFGWAPSTEASYSTALPAEPGAQTPRSMALKDSPCGDVWLRVLFDNDSDGRVSKGDSTCLEGNAQAVLALHIHEGENLIACHPGQPLP